MLRACRRVLRAEGRLGFQVIHVASDLSSGDYERAVSAGPEYVEADAEYPELLEAAGFASVEVVDVTEEYRRILVSRVEHSRPFLNELRSIYGAEVFDDRWAARAKAIEATDAGLLERSFVVVSD